MNKDKAQELSTEAADQARIYILQTLTAQGYDRLPPETYEAIMQLPDILVDHLTPVLEVLNPPAAR
jgi:hypothetical protein